MLIPPWQVENAQVWNPIKDIEHLSRLIGEYKPFYPVDYFLDF